MENKNKSLDQQFSNTNMASNENLPNLPPSPLNETLKQEKVVPTQVEPSKLPHFPRFNFKDKRRYIVLFALFILLVLVAVTVGLFTRKAPKVGVESRLTNIDCGLSGQKEKAEDASDKLSRKADGFDEEYNSKIIAKLLNREPLVIEVLDRDPWSNFVRDSLGIEDELSVREDSFDELNNLTFGDIFEAKQYSYLVGGIELGMASGIYDIKRFEGKPGYYHEDLTSFPSISRSGILIRYHSFELGTLIVYKDGTVYYKDKSGNALENEKLLASQINNLLSSFKESNFDTLANKDSYAQYEPAIALICNRYQNVVLEGNENNLSPINEVLEQIISGFQNKFGLQIKYAEKKQIQLIDWQLTDYPLSQIKKYHDEALALYRSTGNVQENHPAYTKVPDDILGSLLSAASVSEGPFYKSEGKVYTVAKGYGCIKTALVCKDDTLYTLSVTELTEPSDKLGDIHIWPNSAGINLKDISQDGSELPSETYEQNKAFFDKLAEGLGTRFLEDEYLYERVKMHRVDLEQQSKTHDVSNYLLKVNEKHILNKWQGSKPLSTYEGMYLARDQDTDTRFLELKNTIPDKTNQLRNSETKFFFEDNEEYFWISGLSTDTIFVNKLSKSRADEGFFTGYIIWSDADVKLSEIPGNGLIVSQKFVDNNKLKIQFRDDKYYIEGDYLYILELSNEPLN